MCDRGGASVGGARRIQPRDALRMALLASAVAVAPALAVAQSFVFDRLEVEGTQRIQPATVAELAGIPRGEAVGAAQVNSALQNLQNSGLFEEVEVVPQGRTLVVRVQEYPTINVIAFEGNRSLSDDDLAEVVQSRSRRVYSPAQAEGDAALIAEGYRQQGRVAASVTPRIIRRSENRVDLVFEIQEGRVTETERISFVGNRAYSDRRLRRVIESKQAGVLRAFIRADTLIEDRIDFDRQLLTDFYQSRGYVDFQVLSATPQVDRERDFFAITFTVREGQQFSVGDVGVSSEIAAIDPDAYANAIRLRDGVIYNPALIERDIARLERLAVREGRNFVRVEPRVTRNDRNLTLDIEYVLTRGPRVFVERIDIEGNTATLDRVVRRQFDVVEGDPFNPREIRAAAERIEALGFFAETDVNTREGTAPDQVIVDVDVEEQPTGSLGFGASYSSVDGIGFSINFSERNFLGRGQALSFDINSTGQTTSFGFNFAEPAFLGRDLTFGISAFYRESEQNFTRYDTRRAGIAPRLSFPISESTRLELRTEVGYAEVFNVDLGFPEDSDEPGDTGSSAILRAEEDLGGLYSASVGYSLSYDSRRVGLDPISSIQLRFSQDFGVRDDDATFIRSEVLARARREIFNEEVSLLAEFEAGSLAYSGGSSIVTERFSLARKMRGFEPNGLGPRDLAVENEDPLGGDLYAVARFEAGFPLGLPEEYGISGGVFYDIGSVWSLDDTAGGPEGNDEVDDSLIWRSAAGFSIFWDTALGPLRFNFSRALMKEDYDEEQNFEFTISTRF
ncbi:MAG: beta barrel protein insertion system outer membrane component BamA [Rhodobacteraceae bacterium HLUCCA09]|nr:MAG: beta barrel protein insertion system outer membrane component BamA [Rhodobacteraceae bacterium HLUCCA09]